MKLRTNRQYPEGRWEGIMGRKGEGVSGTTIKDTWTKTRGSGIRGGRWGWLGSGGVVGGKGRKLYLNNNKIQKCLIKKYI